LNQTFGFNNEKDGISKETKATSANNKSINSKKSKKKEVAVVEEVEKESDDDDKFKQLNDIRRNFRREEEKGRQLPVQLARLPKDPLEMNLRHLGSKELMKKTDEDALIEKVTRIEFDNFIFKAAWLDEKDEERTKFLLARKMYIC
jgi:hypothetical protein